MKQRLTETPRAFVASGEHLRDFGKVELAPGDMISVVTASGRECDVTAMDWGLYLAPSLNGRLAAQGFRTALVENPQGKLFLNAVEDGKLESFECYLSEQGSRVVSWLGEAPGA
jgi:hypothetical protein